MRKTNLWGITEKINVGKKEEMRGMEKSEEKGKERVNDGEGAEGEMWGKKRKEKITTRKQNSKQQQATANIHSSSNKNTTQIGTIEPHNNNKKKRKKKKVRRATTTMPHMAHTSCWRITTSSTKPRAEAAALCV